MLASERITTVPVFFLPGLLCDGSLFANQIRHLEDMFEVRTIEIGARPLIEELADDVLSQLPERFVLVGLSMGGRIAHSICTRFPERCAGLVLMATSARPEAEAQRKRRARVAAYLGRLNGDSRNAGEYLPLLFSGYQFTDEHVRKTVYQMAGRIPAEHVIAQMRAMVVRPDFRPLLSRYTFPVLILAGADDTDTPVEFHEEMKSLIPTAELKVIADCGHLLPLEQPAEVSRLIADWMLRQVVPGLSRKSVG
jgi:pimeloyl-ACP methyl ester carboxylesterase